MRRLWMICGLSLAIGIDQTVPAAQAAQSTKERNRSCTGPAKAVQLLIQKQGQSETLDACNDTDLPVSVVLSLEQAINVAGIGRAPIHKVVPARSQLRLATLQRREADRPMVYKPSFSYSVDYSPAPRPAKRESATLYELPWQGGPFRISQGAGGDFSHNSPKGRYAMDIAMPVGTPVLAARAGKVIAIRNTQPGRLPFPGGNFVRIEHADKSHAAYLHLLRGSVAVKPGDRVEVGSLLGKSGNSGRSTGPHLHFVVQRKVGKELRSIPFRFTRPVDSLPNFAANDPH